MYNKQLIYFLYLINIQIIYSYKLNNRLIYTYDNITDYESSSSHINVYDKNHTLKKNGVLKIKNNINLSYYCKNDICVRVNRNALPEFVEIPDEKGNIKRYISKSYTLDDLKSRKYSRRIRYKFNNCTSLTDADNKNCFTGIYIYYTCTSDSQCLTNKCIDHICIFNEENPIEFCTDIYKYFPILLIPISYSYMHCGKSIGEFCKTNNECGSKRCFDGFCGPAREPSETDGLIEFILEIYILIIIIILFCIYRCCTNKRKNEINKRKD